MSTVRIQVRRGTAADWTSVNPILAAGEMGVESNTNKFKFGNGSSTWSQLSYAAADTPAIEEISQDAINNALNMGSGLTKTYNDGLNTITISVDSDVIALKSYVDSELTNLGNTADDTYIPQSDRGSALGVASLGANGKIPTTEIDTTIIATQADILAVQAGMTVKAAVEAATTANLPATYSNGTSGVGATLTMSSNGSLTIDGVGPLGSGARVLIKNQTDAKQNGVYTVTTVGGPSAAAVLTRASDFDGSPTSEIVPGMFVFNREGTVNARDGYILLANGSGANNAFTLGTDSLVFSQFTGATPLSTGFGLATINDQISVDSSTVKTVSSFNTFKSANDQALATLTTATGNLENADTILDGRIDAVVLVNNTQTTDINTLNGQVSDLTTDKADVTYVDAADQDLQGSIDTLTTEKANLASPTFTGTVTIPGGASIEGFALLANPTFTGTVTLPNTTSIGDISSTEIGYVNGVTSGIQTQLDSKASSSTVSSHTSATTNVHGIVDTSALATKTYADTAVSTAVTALTRSSVGLGNVDNTSDANKPVSTATQTALDLKAPLASPTFTGTVTLPANTISQVHLNDDSVGTNEIGGLAVTTAKIAASAVTEAKIADSAVTSAKIADSAVTSAKIANGTIVNEDINASAAIATSKIDGLDTALSAKAPLASPALTGTPTAPLAATGTNTTQVATTSFVQQEISVLTTGAPGLLNTLDELAAALGDDANYAATVTTSLATKAPLASPTFTGTVTLPTGTVTSAMILDGTIATGDLADAAVTTAKIADSNVTTAKIADSNVTTAKIADSNVTTAKIADSAITSAKIADGTIVDADINASAAIAQSKVSGLTTDLAAKAPLASPTFTGTVTVAASGVAFTDGTQTAMGVRSLTPIKTAVGANTTLDALGTDANTRDTLVPISGAYSVTFDTTGNAKYSIGASIDFYQSSGTGATFVQGSGMTLQYTPGLALRTTYSSATAIKVAASTWLIYGDLKA